MSWRDHIDIDPAALKMPRMDEAELAELRVDMLANGIRHPIEFFVYADQKKPIALIDEISRLDALEAAGVKLMNGDGQLIEGFRHGSRDIRIEHHTYFADRGHDPDTLVASLNLIRRHLTPEQRRAYREAYIAAHPGDSDRKIAVVLKVSHPTIIADRSRLASTGKNLPVPTKPLKRQGLDGKTRHVPQRREKVPPPERRWPASTPVPQPEPTLPTAEIITHPAVVSDRNQEELTQMLVKWLMDKNIGLPVGLVMIAEALGQLMSMQCRGNRQLERKAIEEDILPILIGEGLHLPHHA